MKWGEFFQLVRMSLIETAGSGVYPDEQIAQNTIFASNTILPSIPLELLDDKNIFINENLLGSSDIANTYHIFSLPPDFLRLLSFEIKRGNDVYKVATYYEYNEFLHKRSLFPNDRTPIFTKIGSTILTIPLGSNDSHRLRYIGNRLVWNNNINEEMFISKTILNPLVYYTCALICVNDGNYTGATSFLNLYAQTLQELIRVFQLTPPKTGITPEEEQDIRVGRGRIAQT